jgi:wyosine [tRNA(Phe)-imidazoG37] synthetase (radical SAM superfamily)
MPREDVRRELALADMVVAKMDAPNEGLFLRINRPCPPCTFDDIVRAIGLFRTEYQGKLAIQMMFIEANRSCAAEMARVAEQLSPDEVQINTPLRLSAVRSLTPEDISVIQREFSRLCKVVTVYEASRPLVVPLDLKETLRRRPSAP